MTQVEVPGHVLVWLLRGEAPLLVHDPRTPTIAWTGHDYLVTIPSTRRAKQMVRLEVVDADWHLPWSKQRVRVTGVETVQRGVVRYRATLAEHELASTLPTRKDPLGFSADIAPSGGRCDAEIPRKIRVSVPHSGDDVVFRYRDVGFNPPLPRGTFNNDHLPGARRRFVNCR